VRLAFAGSPAAALPALRALADVHDVAVVVTQPDRPRGRSRQPAPTPVADAAAALGLPVVTPVNVSAPDEVERLAASGAQALCVVAYGQILRPAVLDLFPCLNVHFSLLPAYRGAAPVERAIMDGRNETGVTIMRMDPGMDTGPIISTRRVAITPDEDTGGLTARMAQIGAPMLLAALAELEAGRMVEVSQPEHGASIAPRITGADRPLDPARPAARLADHVRALSPHVGATLELADVGPLIVWVARAVDERPAEPIGGSAGRLLLATPDGALDLVDVQPAGKGRMTGADFLRGRRGVIALARG